LQLSTPQTCNCPIFKILFETFVLQELKRQESANKIRHNFFHYRDKNGLEVDIVVERGVNAVAGIEVKSSATIQPSDFRALRRLKADMGKKFACGVLIYKGSTVRKIEDKIYVIPVRRLWGKV